MRRRWDLDERGHGVADARSAVPGAAALVAAMHEPDWVAEQPELHLVPHLEATAAASGGAVRVDSWHVADGILDVAVTVEIEGDGGRARSVRVAAFALLGAIAETATFVRELPRPAGSAGTPAPENAGRGEAEEAVFELTTGLLEGDGPYASHGHVVRLRLRVDHGG